MERESKSIDLYCDYCGNKIYVRNVYKNDGSFQKDYISLHGKDVCKHCALEVLDKISSKIKEDDVEEIFKVVRNNEFFSDWFE